jgi:hypothetical protein
MITCGFPVALVISLYAAPEAKPPMVMLPGGTVLGSVGSWVKLYLVIQHQWIVWSWHEQVDRQPVVVRLSFPGRISQFNLLVRSWICGLWNLCPTRLPVLQDETNRPTQLGGNFSDLCSEVKLILPG